MKSTLLTLHDPAMARAYYASGEWRDETLYGLAAQHAASRPEAYALRDSRHRLTWSELVSWADAVAEDLASAGLRYGDRVGVWLPNRVEATVTFLACSRAGFVCAPSLHQNHTVDEIRKLMERCGAAALVAQPGHGADADRVNLFEAMQSLPAMRRVYSADPTGNSVNAVSFPRRGAVPSTNAIASPDKIVYLAFTSGTTGQPKGVMHSDNTLLANGRAMVRDWNVDANTIIYSLSPLSHHIGTVALEQMLASGCELVVNDIPKGTKSLDNILATGATYVMGVPTHAIDLLDEVDRRNLRQIGQVKTFYMAGSAIPSEVARRFVAFGITPQNIYGMTENGSHQYTLPDDDIETMVRTCGKSCSAYEVKIWQVDNLDSEAPQGDLGEIGGQGPALMLGYFGNQEATERSFNAHGYFMSGDLGRLDARGNLEIVGRSKDLIIRGGHNIYPSKIEDLAIRYPGVLKVAAFPVKDDRLGERVCLAIVPREGSEVASQPLLKHLFDEGLSKFDMPEYFLSVHAFPTTASGKVLKRNLVEQVRSGELAPESVRFTAPTQSAQ